MMEVLFASKALPCGVFSHWEVKVGGTPYYVGRPSNFDSSWDAATIMKLGTTNKTHPEICAFMKKERDQEYDIVSNNCQHVTARLVQFLEISRSPDCGQLPTFDEASKLEAAGSWAAMAGAGCLARYAAGLATEAVAGPAVAGGLVVASIPYFVPMPSCNADLTLGDSTSNTCQRGDASFLIVTEEGAGQCFYYPYGTKEKAMADFDSWWCSRLLFEADAGKICQILPPGDYPDEIKQGGFAHPYNTIRRAAVQLLKQ